MEPSLEVPSNLPFSFNLHRRSHLRSETYRSLIRIWSNFHGESQVCISTPNVLQELIRQDNGRGETRQISGKETHECGKVVGSEHRQPDNLLSHNEPARKSENETHEHGEIVGLESTQPDNSPSHSEPVRTPGKETHEHGENIGIESTQPNCPLSYKARVEDSYKFAESIGSDDTTFVNISTQELRTAEKDIKAAGSKDGGLGVSQTTLDGVGNVMQITESSDLVKEKELILDYDVERQQMLMTELELIMNSSEELAPENCPNLSEVLLGEDQNGVGMVSSTDIGEKQCDPGQNVKEKPDIMIDCQVDIEQLARKISESSNMSIDEDRSQKLSVICENNKERSSGDLGSDDETQLKEMEWEKSLNTHGKMPSDSHMLGDEDIEEGEISGDIEIDYDSIDMRVGDAVQVEKVDEKQFFKEIIDKRDIPCTRMACPGNLSPNQEDVEKSASKDQEISSKGKSDGELRHKKNRTTSERRKAKKKQNDRKKRAEKNRLLGVKRLKLKPVVKPKPIIYCRHFLKGRCHEGEKCKFSHDTIPLTKTSPCCHFARQSCMKGDDCPFDHDLSKYPCTNFATKGFCSRGDSCLFSHKDTVSSTLDTSAKSESAPLSILGSSHSNKRQNTNGSSHQNIGAKLFSFGVSPRKSDEQNMGKALVKPNSFRPLSFAKPSSKPNQASPSPNITGNGQVENQTSGSASNIIESTSEIPMRKPSMVPNGVNFLYFGQTSLEQSNSGRKPAALEVDKQASSSSTIGIPSKVGHQSTSQSAPSHGRIPDDTQKRNLALAAPKGINFLSLGRDSRVNSQSDRQGCLNPVDASGPSTRQHELPSSAGGHFKSTPKPSQKTLMSALKFAAEFESDKTKKPAKNHVAVRNDETKKTGMVGGAKSNPSKILEFLSSFSCNN